MSPHEVTVPTSALPLTGERTGPGVWHENYWFRRHEAAYAAVPGWVADAGADAGAGWVADAGAGWVADASSPAGAPLTVLDAGCGEGYGTAQLAACWPGARVLGIDYDPGATAHAHAAYGRGDRAFQRAALTALPLADAVVDVVVSLQVLEHIWTPAAYLHELTRVCRPGGSVVLSTPNRLSFSPGVGRGERPPNAYHCREYDPVELADELHRWAPDLPPPRLLGLGHGPRLRALEASVGPLPAALTADPREWGPELAQVVAEVRAEDFEVTPAGGRPGDGVDLDGCLDLVAVLRRPLK